MYRYTSIYILIKLNHLILKLVGSFSLLLHDEPGTSQWGQQEKVKSPQPHSMLWDFKIRFTVVFQNIAFHKTTLCNSIQSGASCEVIHSAGIPCSLSVHTRRHAHKGHALKLVRSSSVFPTGRKTLIPLNPTTEHCLPLEKVETLGLTEYLPKRLRTNL